MQCARCGPTDRKLNGRNLCSVCVQRSIRDGTYHDYPLNERVLAETKVCRGCDQTLPMDAFRFVRRVGGGYFRSRCKPCETGAQADYAHNHRPAVRAAAKARRDRAKLECLTYYSAGTPRCACCGVTRLIFLCLDHVNGGGVQHRKRTGHANMHELLRQAGYPSGYRVLCWNCNHAAHINGGECGCQDE